MLVVAVAAAAAIGGKAYAQQSAPDYAALYEAGVDFNTFLENTGMGAERWRANFEGAELSEDHGARADSIQADVRLLAVAVPGCSDSVNTLPYIARLAERSARVEMRIIHPEAGYAVMQAHPTPDGRAATPTVIVLDRDFREMGAFVERPSFLQEWALAAKDSLGIASFLKQKFARYEEDAGRSTIEEVLDLIESDRDIR